MIGASCLDIYRFVDAEKLSLTFPFGYNFASAFNEEFITCFKWIKNKHSKSKTDSPVLWSDLSIKVNTVKEIMETLNTKKFTKIAGANLIFSFSSFDMFALKLGTIRLK